MLSKCLTRTSSLSLFLPSSLHIRERLLQEVPREPRALLICNLEAISCTVIGIINLFRSLLPREFSKQHNLSFTANPLMDPLKIPEVVSIHSKNKVEFLEICGMNLTVFSKKA